MSTTVLIISITIAVLVIYKLYSVLGFHDESTESRINKIIKNAKQITDERREKNADSMYQFQSKRDKELEDKILAYLDADSKTNVCKIMSLSPNFTLSQFVYQSDFLFTKIFDALKAGDLKSISDYLNDDSLKKLENIISESKFDRTLIKVEPIHINKIDIDSDNNASIDITISSEQMIPCREQYVQPKFQSHFVVGAERLSADKNGRWIVLNFDKI